MQIFDSSLLIWGGTLISILLAFMIFSTWQTMRNRKDEIEGLDLESYHRIEDRKRKLAIVKFRQRNSELDDSHESDVFK
jgi:hypothetical protein